MLSLLLLQVEALEVQVKEMRQESSVSLIGRQRLSPDQASAASAGFAVADAAVRPRILNPDPEP